MPQISSAAALLEEALFQPEHLPATLEAVGREMGFDHFALVHSELERPTFIATDRTMGALNTYAREGWLEADYRAAHVNRGRAGRLFLDHVEVPEAVRLNSDIYHALYVPADMAYFAGWRFSVGGSTWIQSLARSEAKGPASPAEADALRQLAPFANRTLMLARHMREIRVRGMVDGLGAAGLAAIVLDEMGGTSVVTAQAELLFGEDFGIRNGALWAEDPGSRAELGMLAGLARGRGTPDLAPNVVIRRRNGRRPILVQPVRILGVGLDELPGSRLLLMLIDLDRDGGAPADELCRLFGLSRAEAEVAALIAGGHGLTEIADQRGVARETVRVQLRHVFRKLDVNRQGDVMRLVERIGMVRSKEP